MKFTQPQECKVILEIQKKQNFYQMETTVDGRCFATPRGWEDLSTMIGIYEKIDKTIDREVVEQYIQHPKIAKDFANYLELFYKYRTDYQIEEIFKGNPDEILMNRHNEKKTPLSIYPYNHS